MALPVKPQPTRPPETAKYDRAAKLWGVGTSTKGQRRGVWQWYAKDGTLVLEETWRRGACVRWRRWYADGEPQLEQSAAASGAITLERSWLHPRGKWRAALAPLVTFDVSRLPAGVRELRQVPRRYPLTYELFDATGKRLGVRS